MRKFRGAIWLGALAMGIFGFAHANTIDYDLNQASRTLKDITSGLSRLRPGDVATYNRLSGKLTKAAKHLEATQSKSHPNFQSAVQQWSDLQAKMASIAEAWNAAAQASAPPPAPTHQPSQPAPQTQPAQAAQAPQPSQPTQAPPAPQQEPYVEPVNLDPLMDKYQRRNLPKLEDDPSPEAAKAWAQHMQALQTTHLTADLATIEQALQSGAASQEDARRVRLWISDNFQRTIAENIRLQTQKHEGLIQSMMYSVDLIGSIADDDKNGAYRVAGPIHGPNNKVRLETAIRAGAVLATFQEVFGTEVPNLEARVAKLQAARARIDELEPLANEQKQDARQRA